MLRQLLVFWWELAKGESLPEVFLFLWDDGGDGDIHSSAGRALEDAVCSLWRTSQSGLSCGLVSGLECMSTIEGF